VLFLNQPINVFFNPTGKSPAINSSMEFTEVCAAVGGTTAEIPKGSSCINNNEPLVALTLVQIRNGRLTHLLLYFLSDLVNQYKKYKKYIFCQK
jgi:hypothetical protein